MPKEIKNTTSPQCVKNTVVGSALKLLDSNEIDPLRYFKTDEFETEIDADDFKILLNKKEKCGFEFYLEVDYSVPINFEFENKKVDSGGFYENCYSFPFSEEVLKLLDELGYDDNYLKNWVKQYYGKPDYEQIWDGETLYDEDYLDEADEVNYSEVWKVYDYFKIELFKD